MWCGAPARKWISVRLSLTLAIALSIALAASTTHSAQLRASDAAAYPAKRFQSIWIGLFTHMFPSFIMLGVILSLVLK